jgi:hypothetical protein
MTPKLKEFLRPTFMQRKFKHKPKLMHKPKLFFVSLPGLTAEAIRYADEVREKIENSIDSEEEAALTVREQSAGLRAKRRRPSPGLKRASKWGDRIRDFFSRIKTEGTNPNTLVPRRPDIERIEDRRIQNSLTVIGQVKKSKIRRLILRSYLFVGCCLAAIHPPWGALSGVTSIHFARWLIVDRGDTLLFESNYDGSWDSYIDNFVDVTRAGLDLIWNSCEGYPRLGCTDLDSFKTVIRTHQAEDLIFYSAYPDLTVKNIIANTAFVLTPPAVISKDDVNAAIAGSYEIND